jgi:hypothetical protein
MCPGSELATMRMMALLDMPMRWRLTSMAWPPAAAAPRAARSTAASSASRTGRSCSTVLGPSSSDMQRRFMKRQCWP